MCQMSTAYNFRMPIDYIHHFHLSVARNAPPGNICDENKWHNDF